MTSPEPQPGIVLVTAGAGGAMVERLAGKLAERLAARVGRPVTPASADGPRTALVSVLQSAAAAGRVDVLGLLLDVDQDPRDALDAIRFAVEQNPALRVRLALPVGWSAWAQTVVASAQAAAATLAAPVEQTGVVVVGPGDAELLGQANLARLAHVIRVAGPFARVAYGLDGTAPTLPDAVHDLARLGVANVVAIPWMLGTQDAYQRAVEQVAQAAACAGVVAMMGDPPLAQPALVEALAAGLAALDADAHRAAPPPADQSAALRELDRRIRELLPPEYQQGYESVSPQSMGTAGLKFDAEGRVAWDQIWTSFCDLALAGGPPHRGKLLEAVSADEARREPERYQAVVAEIERGIRLVTGLPVVPSPTPGWVGVRCASEEMAVWLMRAIIVENVMVRREGAVLYLPAGPAFTVKREIKNVITAVAKTCHYWTAHLAARRARGAGG